jgi:ABC-type transport system involved in multi-copper enzyme maturation permease subunit
LLRRAYAGWLLMQFMVVVMTALSPQPRVSREDQLRFVGPYLDMLVGQHFFLMVLVTPAFVAGSIADEKSRGTLQNLLIADLSSWEIVAGKLFGRVAQVGFVGLAAFPLFALVAGIAELRWLTVIGVILVSIAPLFALGGLSILSSVWTDQTRDAVLRVYFVLVIAYFLWVIGRNMVSPGGPVPPAWTGSEWLAEALYSMSPLWVLSAAWGKQNAQLLLVRLGLNALAWGLIGVLCTAVAVWRLRPAHEKQLERIGRKPAADGQVASHLPVDEEYPIAWKERIVEGIAPMAAFRRVPAWLGVLLTFLGSVVLGILCFDSPMRPRNVELALQVGFWIVVFSGLVVGVRSSSTICAERERHTWDMLLVTPLDEIDIVQEKFQGIVQATQPYLWFGYVVPSLICSLSRPGLYIAVVALIAAGTAIGIRLMAAVGIWCSARSSNSWRSLLGTVAMGYALCGVLFIGITIAFGACAFMLLGCFQLWHLLPFAATAIITAYIAVHWYSCRHVWQSLLDYASTEIGKDRDPLISSLFLQKCVECDEATTRPSESVAAESEGPD